MTFERTRDAHLVRSILTADERSWRQMVNDRAPAPQDLPLPDLDRLTAVLIRDDGCLMGLFLLEPHKPHGGRSCDVHFVFLPHAWGRRITEAAGRKFIAWAWQHLVWRRLVGTVPSYNRLALRLAKACGFKQFGTCHRAGTRRGKSFDAILLEVRR